MIRDYIMFLLVGICLVLMFFSFITDSMARKRRILLFFMAFFAMILLISDRLAYHFNGASTNIGFYVVRISKFLAYATYYAIIYVFNRYVQSLLIKEDSSEKLPVSLKIVEHILRAGITLLIISQFTGLYYTYDSANVYHRSPGYIIAYIIPMSAISLQLSTIIKYRKNLRKKITFSLAFFTLMPFFAGILQFFIHGVALTGIFIVAVIVLLYCFSILDTNRVVRLSHQRAINSLTEKQRHTDLMVKQTTSALVEAIDAKDAYTNGHSVRVADISVMIAQKVGKSKEECDKIHLIAILHNIGKIGIPDAIINKAGKLTEEEYTTIKSHPKIGREILSKINISPELSIGASFHHERYDGKGYPFGLKGEEIPEIARIIAVADTYDAMASKRSYRNILPKETILGELKNGIGTQFDPKFAKAMIDLINSGQV